MAFNLKNRHFLTLRDFSPREIEFLLKLAADLKAAKYAGTEVPTLAGKDIALIFEKNSTRTRVGFEVAAYEKIRRRCTNPLAIAQLNHTLGEMYWKTIDDRAKAMDLFEQVANCDHPQLAGQACEQLDQLAAAQ